MVAYSFKKRFAAPILAGTKAQTIRGHRKRHARPGELVQLFTGMRTKHCRKIAEPRCIEVVPVHLTFGPEQIGPFWVGDRMVSSSDFDAFAQTDGFKDVVDMARFWRKEHPPTDGEIITFEGVLIGWQPLTPADPLDIGAAR